MNPTRQSVIVVFSPITVSYISWATSLHARASNRHGRIHTCVAWCSPIILIDICRATSEQRLLFLSNSTSNNSLDIQDTSSTTCSSKHWTRYAGSCHHLFKWRNYSLALIWWLIFHLNSPIAPALLERKSITQVYERNYMVHTTTNR
jgi:hypothetical protein